MRPIKPAMPPPPFRIFGAARCGASAEETSGLTQPFGSPFSSPSGGSARARQRSAASSTLGYLVFKCASSAKLAAVMTGTVGQRVSSRSKLTTVTGNDAGGGISSLIASAAYPLLPVPLPPLLPPPLFPLYICSQRLKSPAAASSCQLICPTSTLPPPPSPSLTRPLSSGSRKR
jgi:hypothetical protein